MNTSRGSQAIVAPRGGSLFSARVASNKIVEMRQREGSGVGEW